MKTGIELIAQERQEQIEKHGRTIQGDVLTNNDGELKQTVMALIMDADNYRDFAHAAIRLAHMPRNWDTQICNKMASKSEKERLIIAGALIAAEIDRLQALQGEL